MEPLEWAKQYAAKRSAEEKASKQDIIVKYSSSSRIKKDVRRSVNIGYLFLRTFITTLESTISAPRLPKSISFSMT